jgi:5'-nucleotidase
MFCSFCLFGQKEVLILHTNDLHSQIEPIGSGKNKGLGGMIRIAALVEEERAQYPGLFLFDAGDFWTGTPYFNFYNGKAEIEMMNAMGYDAATLGNHQFDIPVNVLAQRLSEAKFEIVLANYDMKNTPLKNFVKPYTIIEKDGIRVGVFGLCVDLTNLAMEENFTGMIYKDPVKAAKKATKKLKKQKCDIIICLSHLGYKDNFAVDDLDIVEHSKNIDIIIGGHTHTFLEEADVKYNLKGKPTTIVQMGKSGAHVGRIKVEASGK